MISFIQKNLYTYFAIYIVNIIEYRIYVKDFLSDYDYVIADLESPLTSKVKTIVPKLMHLRSDISNVEVLKYLGCNAVTLANNHMYDYGAQGA